VSDLYDKELFPSLDHPDLIEVGVGDLAVAQHPKFLMTPALGSCVGVGLWDVALKQGGLAHIMLPVPVENSSQGKLERFASYAVPELVDLLVESGSPRRRLVAKIAGGAAMFRGDSTLASIGDRNVNEVKNQLRLLNIPLIAEDTGERHARTIEFYLDTGRFAVRSYLYGVKNL